MVFCDYNRKMQRAQTKFSQANIAYNCFVFGVSDMYLPSRKFSGITIGTLGCT